MEPSQSRSTSDGSSEGPTEGELEKLFINAMHEINRLATEDPASVIGQIFKGDIELEYDDEMIINQFPYARTSRQYRELESYYGHLFVQEALDWIMSTKFADGVLYCCIVGGTTGIGCELLSMEKLKENTYKATHLTNYGASDVTEESTIFEVQKTGTGYKISSIDYCSSSLAREQLKG